MRQRGFWNIEGQEAKLAHKQDILIKPEPHNGLGVSGGKYFRVIARVLRPSAARPG
jgi:hypothetical protein